MLVGVLYVEDGQAGQFPSDLANQLWPGQSLHVGIRDQEVHLTQGQAHFEGVVAIRSLEHEVSILTQRRDHEIEQLAIPVGAHDVRRAVKWR